MAYKRKTPDVPPVVEVPHQERSLTPRASQLVSQFNELRNAREAATSPGRKQLIQFELDGVVDSMQRLHRNGEVYA